MSTTLCLRGGVKKWWEGYVEEERKHRPEKGRSSGQQDLEEGLNREADPEAQAMPAGPHSNEKKRKAWNKTKRSMTTGVLVVLILGAWLYFWHDKAENPGVEDRIAETTRQTKGASLVGKSFTEPVADMEFVGIPEGCFLMGSPSSEKDRRSNEGPQHEVCVDGFSMGKYEVTLRSWRKFIKETGYSTDAEKNTEEKGCFSQKNGTWGYQDGRYWDEVGFPQSDRQPVVCISHNDVEEFIHWLNRESGRTYRLPTEAEWEYAARAGSTTSRFWGEDETSACQYGNVADISNNSLFSCNDGYKWTSPVGHFKANAFGLYDMLGNVWEWTNDWYGNDYYGKSPRTNPTGPKSSVNMVNRGGGWVCGPAFVRSALRVWIRPWARSAGVGFRLVLAPGT